MGKYCHVVLSEEELDFGSQTIPIIGVGTEGDRGGYPRKDFTLRNQSVVPATFKVSTWTTEQSLEGHNLNNRTAARAAASRSGIHLTLDQPRNSPSLPPQKCQIRRSESDRDAVFSLNPSEGVIPPEDDIVITATYSPISAGTFSRDHYEIVTVGGNKVSVSRLEPKSGNR